MDSNYDDHIANAANCVLADADFNSDEARREAHTDLCKAMKDAADAWVEAYIAS